MPRISSGTSSRASQLSNFKLAIYDNMDDMDFVDLRSRSVALQSQLDELVSAFEVREIRFADAICKMRQKYSSTIDEATDRAREIVFRAQTTAANDVQQASAEAAAMLAAARNECTTWEAEKASVSDIQKFKPIVKVNVGGTKFTTSLTTLRRFPDTMIGAMYSGRHELVQDDEGYHFIDRDGTHFRYFLNFLRTPEAFECDLTGTALKELKNECEYYGLQHLMFPFTLIPPFSCSNFRRELVSVHQDSNGVWRMNDVPMKICFHCFAADYYACGLLCHPGTSLLLNFQNTVHSKGGVLNLAAQPTPHACRNCGCVQTQLP